MFCCDLHRFRQMNHLSVAIISLLVVANVLLTHTNGRFHYYSDSSAVVSTAIVALPTLHLRFDYTNLERLSPVAKQIEAMQTQNCNSGTTEVLFRHRNYAGLGSDLHIYSAGMCKALEMHNVRFRTIGSWIYNDDAICSSSNNNTNTTNTTTKNDSSPMSCYFPQSEPVCVQQHDNNDTNDIVTTQKSNQIHITDDKGEFYRKYKCQQYTEANGGTAAIRAGTTEYLFTRISPIVVQEAQRQLELVFGTTTAAAAAASNNSNINTNKNHTEGTPKTMTRTINQIHHNIPKNLITVHIRWGDKGKEMKLVGIGTYLNAIQQILDRRRQLALQQQQQQQQTAEDHYTVVEMEEDDVNIYLSTEDPEAVQQFMIEKPKHWNVYLDQYYVEMLQFRNEIGNVDSVNVMYSEKLQGRNGLIALGSLLVAMEANEYVLTTKSNWSRLMNEIRKNIIDPRCNNCTYMIDLRRGEF